MADAFVPSKASRICDCVYPAFFWYIMATMPATCGAAMLVPCRTIRLSGTPAPPRVIRDAEGKATSFESAASITSPGAARSGFARPSRVGPSELKALCAPTVLLLEKPPPEAAVQLSLETNEPTVSAPDAVAGSPRVVRYDCVEKVAPPPVIQASHSPVLPARAKAVLSRSIDHPVPPRLVAVTESWQRLRLVDAVLQFEIEKFAPPRL